jgi:hypothetical protein
MEPQPRHLREIWEAIHQLERQQAMSQTEIDALTAAVGQIAADLEADTTALQEELNKLEQEKAAGQPLNLGGLQSAVAALEPKAVALGKLTPEKPVETPPAPPAETPAPPVETPPSVEAGGVKVETTTTATPIPPSEPAKTVYVYTPAEGTDVNDSFTPSGFTGTDGETLYYFSGDTQPGEDTGTSIPGYTVFEGTATPVAAS